MNRRWDANDEIERLRGECTRLEQAAVCERNARLLRVSERGTEIARLRQIILDVENALDYGKVEVPVRVVERVKEALAKGKGT